MTEFSVRLSLPLSFVQILWFLVSQTYVLSELLLVLLSVGMLAACQPAHDDSIVSPTPFVGAIAGFACLTRTAAAPLAVAGLLHAYISRGTQGIGWFVGVVSLMVAPWVVLGVPVHQSDSLAGRSSTTTSRYDIFGGRGGGFAIYSTS